MGNKTIKDITDQQTVINSTDWFEIQEDAGTSKKIQYSAMTASFPALLVGESIQYLMSYKPISAAFPWLCLSTADSTLSTTHYSQDFIDVMRDRKIIYDELNTAVYQFSGSWTNKIFTLDDNAANVSMITELYEDYLFNGSVGDAFRVITTSAGQEFYMIDSTAINVASRTITVTAGSNPTASTYIEVHLNRIVGSTTSCKHFSWAGLGLYMVGGNKVSGLRRRDAMQGHKHQIGDYSSYPGGTPSDYKLVNSTNFASTISNPVTDGTNGTPRTASKTRIESGTLSLYLYVGSYTA